MSNTQTAAKALLTINTDDLPAPDATSGGIYSYSASNTGTSQPADHAPDVVDSGRIKFGAICRIPAPSALPRPTGSMPNVTDSGRIGFGGIARLPVSK